MEICCISFFKEKKKKKKKTAEQDNYIDWPRQSRGQFLHCNESYIRQHPTRGKKDFQYFGSICSSLSCASVFPVGHQKNSDSLFRFHTELHWAAGAGVRSPQLFGSRLLEINHTVISCVTVGMILFCSNLSRVTFLSHTSLTPLLANNPSIRVWLMSRLTRCQAY